MNGTAKSVEAFRRLMLVGYPGLGMAAIGLLCLVGFLQTRVPSAPPDPAAFDARIAGISDDLDWLIGNAAGDLQSCSRAATMQRPVVRDRDLVELAETSVYFRRLVLVDTVGFPVAGDAAWLPPPAWFHGLMEEALANGPVVSAPQGGETADAPEQAYALVPVLDDIGQPRYILVGELAMDRVWRLLEPGADFPDAVVALLDDCGRILLPDPAGPAGNPGGQPTPPAPAGCAWFYAVRQIPGAETGGGPAWTVLMLRPYAKVAGLVRRGTLLNTAGAMLTLGLVGLVGIRMNRRVYGPLADAVQAAARVADGRLNEFVPEDGPREVLKIAEAINHMTAEVRYHRHTLSRMVQARTENLEAARQTLEQNMRQLQASYDSAQNAILVVDVLNGEILHANRPLRTLFGFGDVDVDSLTGDDFCAAVEDRFLDPAGFRDRWQYYATHPDAEGTEEWILRQPRRTVLAVYTSPVRSLDQRAITGRLWSIQDVTRQREMEERLRQSQKMDAMGHLAGTLAHDFRNLLTVVIGNLAMARADARGSGEAQGCLDAAEAAAREAAGLAGQLLGFSSRACLRLETVNLNRITAGVADTLRQAAIPRVTVRPELSDALWDIPADPAQLEQVILHLGMNALDAMPEGGDLVLRTGNATLEAGECGMPPAMSAGEYVCLAVRDTGVGMADAIRERVFEPFFTTRADRGSQGLGLAMAYAAISKHGGWITCESAPGQGATFSLYLQRSQPRSIPMTVEQSPQAGADRPPTVLVVDDEAGVRRILVSILTRSGLGAIEAADGEEAIRVYQQRRAEISAVLLDMSMPKLSGRDTFAALKQLDPALPILICSGYPVDGREFAAETGFVLNGVIEKPFNLAALRRAVTGALDASLVGAS